MTAQKNACDVCGRKITGKPQFRYFEGARLMVCDICARFAEKQQPPPQKSSNYRLKTPQHRVKRKFPKRSTRNLELRDDYAKIIREAREKKNWTQKKLANKLLERLSMIRRIESGKMQPEESVIKKLEQALDISLFISTNDIPEVKLETKIPSDMTLGDIVHLKTKKKQSED
ncbi:MAG: multiprotein bridging factor aMBF1 [Candidatus Helarchaeota archaeon]